MSSIIDENVQVVSQNKAARLNFKQFTYTSIIFGFFLIPIHEFGHVFCDWITGHPAAMSYARDYLLSGGNTPFLGLLGGPLFPLIMSTIAVILIYRGKNISIFYPIAITGILDRSILYILGMLPSDERDLAGMAGWNIRSFQYIFLAAEIILLALIVISLIRNKAGIKHTIFVFIIPVIAFVAGAAIGVLVVERFLFPAQFKIQFG